MNTLTTVACATVDQNDPLTNQTPRERQMPMPVVKPLRPHQSQAIADLRAAIKGGSHRPVLGAFMGFGKTRVAAEIIRSANEKGIRVMFMVASRQLCEQSASAFDEQGLDVGIMMANHIRTDETRLCQVCTFQTVTARLKRERYEFQRWPVGLILIDECDVQMKGREDLATMYPDAPIIGMSGTVFARGMGNFYTSIVNTLPVAKLIEQGYLCPFEVFGPPGPDMSGAKIVAGDWSASEVEKRFDSTLMASVVDMWKQHGRNRPTLMFAANVAHSKALVRQFQEAGITEICHLDGYPDGEDAETDDVRMNRELAIEKYNRGEIKILSSVALLSRGFDAPQTEVLIVARATRSLSLHWQIIGRSIRTYPGKTLATILDHSTNHQRLGYITDPIPYVLDDGSDPKEKPDSRKKEDPLPTPCPFCHCMRPAGVRKCPSCLRTPERQNDIENVEGELVKLGDSTKSKEPQFTAAEKDRWMRMFKDYEIEKGKANGYSIYLFKEKFGHEPATLWPRTTLGPTDEFSSWMKHHNIKMAKRAQKRKEAA